MDETKEILLVSMPTQDIYCPSIQLGLLKKCITQQVGITCNLLHAYLLWPEYFSGIIQKQNGDMEKSDILGILNSISLDYAYDCMGDWIFSKALNGDTYNKNNYLNYLKKRAVIQSDQRLLQYIELVYEMAPEFIEYIINYVDVKKYKIIAFSTTFAQTVASLACAKRIKEQYPDKIIIFGGANCDDKQGEVLIKNFPFINFIVSGEGEYSLPQLIKTLLNNKCRNLTSISGLIYTDINGTIIHNQEELVDIQSTPFPDYDDYFSLLDTLDIGEFIQPRILIEASKGCWWGEKHHCLFCGINDNRAHYRCRSAETVFGAIMEYMKKYKCGDFFFTDNIICNEYFNTLFHEIVKSDFDLNIFAEIKANLTREKAIILRDAGVRYLQPGIESLSTPVLRIMNKGTTSIQNVYILKLAKEYSLYVGWNFLYGFPNEIDEYYTIELWKSLTHLPPPLICGKIVLERNSPLYFNNIYGTIIGDIAEPYTYIYKLDKAEIAEIAYMFEGEYECISSGKLAELSKFINEWKNDNSYLFYKKRGKWIEISDSRLYRKKEKFILKEDVWISAFTFLEDIREMRKLIKYLNEECGYIVSEKQVKEWCDYMVSLGYLYVEEKYYLSIVLPYNRLMYDEGVS